MPKITSEKQRRANAENARKSTGPKTAAGKARVARNALKHGLLATNVVVHTPNEKQADFDALLNDLCAELKPHGIVEKTLVERIATCYWRLRRAQQFEADAIRGALETQRTGPSEADLKRVQAELDQTCKDLATERRLHQLLDLPDDRRTKQQANELDRFLEEFARAYSLDEPNPQGNDREHQARNVLPGVLRRLERKAATLHTERDAAQRQQVLHEHQLSASLPDGSALIKVVRYETMLDRQIHRAFAELRRRQTNAAK